MVDSDSLANSCRDVPTVEATLSEFRPRQGNLGWVDLVPLEKWLPGEPAEWSAVDFKNHKELQHPLLGNDPDTSVFRVRSGSRSIVLKTYANRRKYRRELFNVRLVNELLPGASANILGNWDGAACVVFEDVGDRLPPSPAKPGSETFWREAMVELAKIHAKGVRLLAGEPNRTPGVLCLRKAPVLGDLCGPITRALSECQRTTRSYGAEVAVLLSGLLHDLRDYQARDGFGLGERSVSNIRCLGGRIVHIDLVQCLRSLPHPDFVPVWHSPYRDRALKSYVAERLSWDGGFNADQFYKADNEFTILESLRWIAIRTGHMGSLTRGIAVTRTRKERREKIERHVERIREAGRALRTTAPAIAASVEAIV